jgi:hypothetical protein
MPKWEVIFARSLRANRNLGGEEGLDMTKNLPVKPSAMFAGVLVVLLALALSGCSSNEAEAADDRLVQTFTIAPNTFSLRADVDPTIEIGDETNTYTLNSNGSISFAPTSGPGVGLELDAGDIVIERPASGIVTVIRSI